MPDIRKLREQIKPSRSDSGDGKCSVAFLSVGAYLTVPAISSIVVAVQMIVAYCKKLKYRKKIVLVTNGLGAVDNEEIDEIAGKIKEENIDLVIL